MPAVSPLPDGDGPDTRYVPSHAEKYTKEGNREVPIIRVVPVYMPRHPLGASESKMEPDIVRISASI